MALVKETTQSLLALNQKNSTCNSGCFVPQLQTEKKDYGSRCLASQWDCISKLVFSMKSLCTDTYLQEMQVIYVLF